MLRRLYKIKKRTIAFFTVVPLLAITSIITAPCPVCDGTGVLAITPGMENVEILEYEAYEWKVTRESCGLYILWFWDIDITLLNRDTEPVEGWLKLTLVDVSKPDTTPVVDTQYRMVELSGASVVGLSFTVVFGTGIDAYGQTGVQIEVMTGDVPDIVCRGTGRVPLNASLFINGLRDTFIETIKGELKYRPPEWTEWEWEVGE